MAGRKSKFAHFVAGLTFCEPADMIQHFWPELMEHAARVEASLDGVEIVTDGQRHYLRNLKGEDDQRQYYIANLVTDGDDTVWPSVTFGSFKQRLDNVYFKPRDLVWRSFESHKDDVVVDLDRHAAYRERIKEARQEAQRQAIANETIKREAQEAAAEAAAQAWQAAQGVDPAESHAYLLNKGLSIQGRVRVAAHRLSGRLYSHTYRQWYPQATIVDTGDLLLPVYSADPTTPGLINVQRIARDGSKRFLMGGQKKLGYMPVMPDGWSGGAPDALVIVEGYATGASLLHTRAFGERRVAIIVAFDSGNVAGVAAALMEKYPGTPVILAADNDQSTPGNPGMTLAANLKTDPALRLPFIAPTLPDGDTRKVDFDDLRQWSGEAEVTRQVADQFDGAVHFWRLHHDPEYRQKVESGEEGEGRPALNIRDHSEVVDDFSWPNQKRGSVGKPLPTEENLEWMTRQYGITMRYNEITKDVEIDVPGENFSIDNRNNVSLSKIRDLCARNELPREDVESKVKAIADRQRFNPIVAWIKSRPWDGHDYLTDLFNTLTLAPDVDPKLAKLLLVKWMLGAVALADNQGHIWSKSVLVFTGEQSQGKTSWFRALVPESTGLTSCIADGLHLDPADKDTVATVLSHWLVELGELDATFRKADIARLKAFITKKTDKLRRPYDRQDSEYPRRTALFASVNEDRFMQDQTGNSRWWAIEVLALDHEHDIDMQQAWAQCHHLLEQGMKHYLSPAEEAMLAGSNTRFEQVDPLEEMILSSFEVEVGYDANGSPVYRYDPHSTVDMTATQVLIHAGIDKPTRSQATTAGAFLRKLTGAKARRAAAGNVYRMPAPKQRGGQGPGGA